MSARFLPFNSGLVGCMTMLWFMSFTQKYSLPEYRARFSACKAICWALSRVTSPFFSREWAQSTMAKAASTVWRVAIFLSCTASSYERATNTPATNKRKNKGIKDSRRSLLSIEIRRSNSIMSISKVLQNQP